MLQNLINYTLLADKRMIDAFGQTSKSMPDAEKLFSHILNSQHIWVKRIFRETPEYENIHLKNSEYLLRSLHTLNLEEPLIYTNSQGAQFVNTISDILFHVVNHSTYHRGQVASQFRLNGIIPPVTDYILLKREGLL
jgi:uncharacterized damage-inducible protein DinB